MTEKDLEACTDCSLDSKGMSFEDANRMISNLRPNWEVVVPSGKKPMHLKSTYALTDDREVATLWQAIWGNAMVTGHHPNIYVRDYNKMEVEAWTHKANNGQGGITNSDIRMATEIQNIYSRVIKR